MIILPFVSTFLFSCHDSLETNSFASSSVGTDVPVDDDLPRPDRVLQSRDDFIDTLDYLAFYQIDETISFQVSDGYRSLFRNIYQEFLQAHKCTEIASVFHVDLDRTDYDANSTIALTLFPNPALASVEPLSSASDVIFVHPADYRNEGGTRDEDFEAFPLDRKEVPEVDVSDGQQLYYVLSQGYRPRCRTEKVLRLYQEMRNVLRRIVSDDMDETTKVRQIYGFLTSEVRYDDEVASQQDSETVLSQSYYLEGVFFHRVAVCDGKSKAFVSLAAIESIDAVRIAAEDDDSKHAYNLVSVDGKWHLICTTYGSTRMEWEGRSYVLPSYSMFLTNGNTPYDTWSYQSEMHRDIQEKVSLEPYPYFEENGLVFSDVDALVDRIVDYKARFSLVNVKFDFVLEGVGIDAVMDAVDQRDFGLPPLFLSDRNVGFVSYSVLFLGGER